jgi:hypothetical protein
MSLDWNQVCWDPDGRGETVASEYERLCRLAWVAGLHVELRIVESQLAELGLSNGLGVDLTDIRELPWAAYVLRDRLAKEIAR